VLKLLVFFILLSILLAVICYRLLLKLKEISFLKKSQSVKYGKISEQFMPFVHNYPYEPSRFRFIGSPIDGVQFEDDRIIFVEFKTGKSRLTSSQEKVRKIIEKKRVTWEEFRISD